jgi:hypothetical protein
MWRRLRGDEGITMLIGQPGVQALRGEVGVVTSASQQPVLTARVGEIADIDGRRPCKPATGVFA